MSFLYKVSTTSARVARLTPRITTASRSPFSISAPTAKSALDPVKDALKAVDRTVSDAAVKGIETGEQMSQAAKETIGVNASKASGEAKGSAQSMAGQAKGKMHEMAGEAKGSADSMTGESSGSAQSMMGEAKGKAHEVAGQAQGKAQELKGEVKGKAQEVKAKM